MHTHKLKDGRTTGKAITSHEMPNHHKHMVEGESTSFEEKTDNHTHIFNTEITLGPDDMTEKSLEVKQFNGRVVSCKETERAGVKIGIVEGYIATWDLDRGAWGIKDKFVKGAFVESIAEFMRIGRQIRLKDHHGRTVGGFPIEGVKEDDRGLFGIGEINLDVQQGREAYALAVQGVLTDFSIGFEDVESTEADGVRTITKAIIWEGSIVDEPMNPHANIVAVKKAVPFQNLQVAEKATKFVKDEAIARIKEFTKSEEAPSLEYKNAFLRFEEDRPDSFGAYRLVIADVIDGKLTAVPEAIFKAADDVLNGQDVPEQDKGAVIKHLERYYAKMGMDSPFTDHDKQYFIVDDVKAMDVRSLEKALKSSGSFSNSACKFLAGALKVDKSKEKDDTISYKTLIEQMQDIGRL